MEKKTKGKKGTNSSFACSSPTVQEDEAKQPSDFPIHAEAVLEEQPREARCTYGQSYLFPLMGSRTTSKLSSSSTCPLVER